MANYLELTLNGLALELSSGVNNSVTSLPVVSTTGFPEFGRYRVKVDDEIMIARYSDSTNLTVERGAESTTAASHSDGAAVTIIATAEGIDHAMHGHGGMADGTCDRKPFRFIGSSGNTNANSVTCYFGGTTDGPIGGKRYGTGYFQLEPYDILWFEGTIIATSTLGDWRAGRIAWCVRHDGAVVTGYTAGGSMTFNEAYSDSNAAFNSGTGVSVSGEGFVINIGLNNASRKWRVLITGMYSKLNVETTGGSY